MASGVLVPMDASEPARRALAFALKEHPDAEITVLHVTNPVQDTYFASEEEFYTNVDVRENADSERAKHIFDTANRIAADRGRSLNTHAILGPPAAAIVEFAEERGMDQIVIGSHGRSGVARLLLGSVAEKVARRASIPVTIVK